MSESNRVTLKYVPEVTYGTTPVNSVNWKYLRFTSEALGGDIKTVESAELRADRMISDNPKTGTDVKGTISGEFSSGSYDDFIEAVLGGTWTANVLKVGVVERSYTLEKNFADIAKLMAFKGMRVGQMDIKLEFGALATVEFGFAGNNYSLPVASLVGSGSVADLGTTAVFNGSANISGIKIDGVASTDCFKSLNISINNNLRPQEGLGSDFPSDQNYGACAITGDFSVYLADLVLEQKKIDNTAFSLEFTVSIAGVGYVFFFPKLKFGGSSPASGGKDQDVFLEGKFSALYNATEASSIVITRLP